MKKFLSMLTLVLALCLVCGAALAEGTPETPAPYTGYDYANPQYFKVGTEYFVRFLHKTDDVYDKTFIEYPLYVEDPEYTELGDLGKDDIRFDTTQNKVVWESWLDVKSQTCTTTAVLKLKPVNVEVRTSIAEIAAASNQKIQAATPEDLAHTGYSFYGLPQQFARETKTIDMAELKKANLTVYNVWSKASWYKALDHNFSSFRTEQEATCEEPGVVYPVCSRCRVEDEAVITDPKGHKSLLTNPAALYAEGNVSGMVQVTVGAGATEKKYVYTLIAEPYCEREGVYVGYCGVCGDENALFSIDKVNGRHKYGDWIIEDDATCNKTGSKYQLCTVCLDPSVKRIETIPELHHKLVLNVIEAATCTETGTADTITCSRCEAVATVTAPSGQGTNGDKPTIKVNNRDMAASMQADILATIGANGTNYNETTKVGMFVLPKDVNNHPVTAWKKVTDSIDSTNEYHQAATCTEDGFDSYYCGACNPTFDGTDPKGIIYTATVPATDHEVVTVIQQKVVTNGTTTWNTLDSDAVLSCKRDADGKPVETYRSLTFCLHEVETGANDQVDYNGTPTGYPTPKAEALLPEEPYEVVEKEVVVPDHTFTAWTVRNEPTAGTPGYWFRDCTVCREHEEYIGYVAPGTGLTLGDDGIFYYYKDGVFDPTFNGLVEYNGATFLAVNGKVDGSVSGLKLVGDEFLFFANNQLQAVDTFAIYDGAMFVIKAGKLDLTANGLLDYDGGKFVFAAGKLQSQANGLWLNPADNTWCFLANGQLQAQYSGIASYNGALFLLKDGKLATGAAGTYEQDGVKYIVDDAGNAAIAA